MSLKIFADLMSQPSRAIVMFCRAAKVPHEFKELRIKNGDFKTPEMAKINPFEKVSHEISTKICIFNFLLFFQSPCAEHNGVPLVESMAILRYITNVFDVDSHWYPKDPLAQQKVEEYLHWQHTNTRLQCAMYFQVKIQLKIT